MTFQSSRAIPAPPESVFAAISNPERLARWWGPAGFTNTFKSFDFKPGGAWSFTMHGPDGKNYNNETTFEEIDAPRKVVFRHVSQPCYRLTITLEPAAGGGTRVGWSQAFDNPDVGLRLRHILEPANEQNLDKLTAEVLRQQRG